MEEHTTGTTRIALVGTGRIGVVHARALAGVDGVDLSICDADGTRAQRVAGQLGVGHAAIEDVLAPGSGIAGIVIATPTSTHEDLILRCAQAGVPFFCEKPVVLDLAGTRRCIDAVRRAHVASQIGFQRRFDPGYAEARRRVQSGELGEIHRVHMLTCDQSPPGEQFVATSGGIFRDCLIHDFDALRWVTGHEVAEVFAYGAVRGEPYFARHGDVDEAVVALRMEDDTLATAHTSRNNGRGYDVRMEISGTSGNATVGLEPKVPLVSVEPGVRFPENDPWVDFIARFATCYEVELRAFVDVVRGVSESPCPIGEAGKALAIALAATRSCREGRPVRVSEIRES